jgi:pimeloyl-ACP methyl ester carboxylesterase/predicted SnoaL-like aldol condensation-catalyzing enzyme
LISKHEGEIEMGIQEKNKSYVLEAFDTLFNKRDYVTAEKFWSPNYIQHSARIAPGRDGLFNLVKSLPSTFKYEPGLIVADGNYVIVHGRYSGFGDTNWIAADILRIKDGIFLEHWDVLQDEATEDESLSKAPMFGSGFPVYAWPDTFFRRTTMSQESVKNEYIDVFGNKIAYRYFGTETNKNPLVFMQHYYGNMDHWDPVVTHAFAQDRKVLIFNYQGVGLSGGESPSSVEDLTTATTAFIEAMGLKKVDILGFSLGGMIAQEMCLRNVPFVDRVILLSTGPCGGEGMEFAELDGGRPPESDEDLLGAFFTQSAESQQAGREYIARTKLRTKDRDQPPSKNVAQNQLLAIRGWGKQQPGERYADLARIKRPTLVVTGLRDIVLPAINSFILADKIPNAHLIAYPDSGHGAYAQYDDLFVKQTKLFLDVN